MAKHKKPRVKHESGPTGMDKEAETEAIEKWLRRMDKPLAGKKRQKGRGAKRRRKR